ncbi:thermonuclease family protein [Brucella intermedia]|uniref:thermonuclease family protein n=1 Tax=Brucella intermedia TaxID=94625 RepID=UPI0034CF1891
MRIVNIDAPEIEGKCRFETDLAQQSKQRLASILEGSKVEILRQDTDRYGRTLAGVRVNGQDAGDMLVAEGLARTWSGRREPWC